MVDRDHNDTFTGNGDARHRLTSDIHRKHHRARRVSREPVHITGDATVDDASMILVDTSQGAITVTLDDDLLRAGQVVRVIDDAGQAASNPITVAASGTATIEPGGVSSKSLTVDWGEMELVGNPDGNHWRATGRNTEHELLQAEQASISSGVTSDLPMSEGTTFVHDRDEVTSDATTDGSGYYLVDTDAAGGSVTLTLDSSDAVEGREVNVKREGSNDVAIDTEGTGTIDGSDSITLTQDQESVTLVYNNADSDWEIW